jgi:ABC-type multidrug transport system ATPase subunit
MRQRVSLARALVHDPGVLLLDEPFEGLDPQGQAQFLEVLRSPQTRGGRAVLVITQNVDLGFHLADRVAVMDRGALLKVSPREAVSPESLVKELRTIGGQPPAR